MRLISHPSGMLNCGRATCTLEMIPSIGEQKLPVIYATMLRISRRRVYLFAHTNPPLNASRNPFQLPCSFKEWAVRYTGGKGPNHILMAHCHREMFHEQWNVLLDDEFLEAYEHGILIQCCDGITRRLYPRIFTYSADHPEKLAHSHYCHFYSDHLLAVGPLFHLFERVECVLALAVWFPNPSFHNLVHRWTKLNANLSHVWIVMTKGAK